MRLYLSSFRNGRHPHRLLELVGDDRRTAVIFNAVDSIDPEERADRLADEFDRLGELGLDCVEVDLREHFDDPDPERLRDRLQGFGLVWVRGGNTFVLRRAMHASRFDVAITQLLDDDEVVYGGYSAGVCVLAPSLRGIELCDDPSVTPGGYDGTPVIWEGLGLLPYAVAPHYRSDHPETDRIEDVVEWFRANDLPFRTLRDGDVILIKDGREEILT